MMNDKTAESSIATGLRIAFAIIGAFIIMICTCAAALRITVLRQTFWNDMFKSDEVRELLKNEMGLERRAVHTNSESGVSISIEDEDVQDEFIDMLVDDVLVYMTEGELDLDRDKYEDFFEEYEDELFEGQDLTSAQKREETDRFIDELQEIIDDYGKENDISEQTNVMSAFKQASTRTFIIAVVTGVILAAMTAVLIAIHKNKFRPVRAMGISMTCAQFINMVGWGFVVLVLKSAADYADESDPAVLVFVDVIGNYAGYITAFMAATFFIGIALIVVGVIGVKRTNERLLEE